MDPKDKSDKKSSASPANQPSRTTGSETLLEAIEEMELLLSHATHAGIVVPVDRIEAFVRAKREAGNGAMDAQVEIDFWQKFQELGQQLHPISVDSLKATTKGKGQGPTTGFWISGKRLSVASRAVRRYQIWSVVALFLLLVTQIYTIFGSNAVNDILLLINQIDSELLKIDDLYSRAAAAATSEENKSIVELIREADANLISMYDRLAASYELLALWFPARFSALDTEVAKNRTRLQIAQIILESLSKYLLPLLYGLLGACVFVLRSLSLEIKNLIYTVESDIRFRLRIYLGALAGLAIGWFITDQTAPGVLRSVAPIALAFIAGYSVELMFSAMDTIINAFVTEPKGSAKVE